MKDRHLYVVIAAAFLILGATNLVTVYLYAKERILHHKTERSAQQRLNKMEADTAVNFTDYRKKAQQKFLETLHVMNIAKEEQAEIRQQLLQAMTQRGKRLQALRSNRTAGLGDALKIIQEDAAIFSLYNQYLQIADGREKTFVEKAKPLGISLGIKPQD